MSTAGWPSGPSASPTQTKLQAGSRTSSAESARRVISKDSMQGTAYGGEEFRDRDLERHAILAHTVVGSTHGAHRGGQRTTARVFEAFSGSEQRLLADHAQAAHFFGVLLAVGDHPMAADHLHGLLAAVRDTHG